MQILTIVWLAVGFGWGLRGIIAIAAEERGYNSFTFFGTGMYLILNAVAWPLNLYLTVCNDD